MVSRKKSNSRKRIGNVSYYQHHGAWWIYYRDGQTPVRRRVAESEELAGQIAAQVNAQLATSAPTLFSFHAISIPDLQRAFLEYHELVISSSTATVKRYRAATQHLINFVTECCPAIEAHLLDAAKFLAWLRQQEVSPNGHANTTKRQLRDKGLRYIMEVCRSLYSYAGKQRHLPPYTENPFANLKIDRMRIDDAKPIFVFHAETELQFLKAADEWTFPIQFVLAKTGMRSGELTHLFIEDLDFNSRLMHIRNKPALHWMVKTRRERVIPIIDEVVSVLEVVVGERTDGPVFLRQQFRAEHSPFGNRSTSELIVEFEKRLEDQLPQQRGILSKNDKQSVARTVWRDAGAVRGDRIRTTFIRAAKHSGLQDATCPKSWRHTFATLLQDANIDPLIRQITLGHKPSEDSRGGLGMTTHYTHTRIETQRREIERALRLWPQSLSYAAEWSAAQKQ